MSDTCPTVKIKTATGYALLNESDFDPAKYELYVPPAPVELPPVLLPPPPSGPADPLANLPADWERRKTAELRDIVNAATGRMPETREQAIAIIKQTLAERAPK